MRSLRFVGSLAVGLVLLGTFFFVTGVAPAAAQEPTVIGTFALVKYVCSADIGATGSTVPSTCVDANDPNGANVPVLAAGSALSFLYEATYTCPTGSVCTPINPISITLADNQLPGIAPAVYGALQDVPSTGVIDPTDIWLFVVRGQQAINLTNAGLTLPGGGPIQGCANVSDGDGARPTYVNSAQITGPSASNTDTAAYCNPVPLPTAVPPTALPPTAVPPTAVPPTATPIPSTPAPVPIPEPMTVVLFGTGQAALSAAMAARKRTGK